MAQRLSYLVIGAMARDILLSNVYGLDVERATRDIDLAIAIQDWPQFTRIKENLILGGNFRASNTQEHRLYYIGPNGANGYPIDIVPFGEIESPRGSITWPKSDGIDLGVVGFVDAVQSAVLVKIDRDIAIPFVSLACLSALKLFAWRDRRHETTKDALDFAALCQKYCSAGNADRIYGEFIDALGATGYDMQLAGAFVLGVDIRRAMKPSTVESIRSLLADAELQQELVLGMVPALKSWDDPEVIAAQFIERLLAGLIHE